MAVLDVDSEEGGAEDDPTGGGDAEECVHCWLNSCLLHLGDHIVSYNIICVTYECILCKCSFESAIYKG